jgi:adenosylmethionine-8-amino-7-oxononanoate aminotransferase
MNPAELDQRHLWHPFTPHAAWLDPAVPPLVIAGGEGASLIDTAGNRYLDGNSSIWTNLHGHGRREINDAITAQLGKIAHSSFLGLSNEPAPVLGEKLCRLSGLGRCFFSDDGSTAMEAALKIVYQYFQQNGQPQRTNFLSLSSAYHGDTVGAMSLGHSPVFHRTYAGLVFQTHEIPAPFVYRSPEFVPSRGTGSHHSRLSPEAFLRDLEGKIAELGPTLAALVVEPRVQGAAGFIMHPDGWLGRAAALAQKAGAKVILDEVMTGFGRTGPMFAFQKEDVRPDVIAVAKGLTGGYLPLAATLLTEELFEGFGGDRSRTFYHGHSYTGNQLGCAAALASLGLLGNVHDEAHRNRIGGTLERLSHKFWEHPNVGDVRREGTILAVELVADFATKRPLDPALRTGARVCDAARAHGLLTRPVADVLLLMPPYCATETELARMTDALLGAVADVLPV